MISTICFQISLTQRTNRPEQNCRRILAGVMSNHSCQNSCYELITSTQGANQMARNAITVIEYLIIAIILLNRAEYRLILGNSAYGLNR